MPPTCSSRRWRAATLRTIGATTWAEYKKYIEKDPALTRRFQVDAGGRADERQGDLHAARRARRLEKHHRVQHARRGDRGGGQVVAPLHSGTPAAGQGGQPARHGLRARCDQPARHAGRGRGLPATHRSAAKGAEIIEREARRHRRGATRRARTRNSTAERARQSDAARWTKKRSWSTEIIDVRRQIGDGGRAGRRGWRAQARAGGDHAGEPRRLATPPRPCSSAHSGRPTPRGPALLRRCCDLQTKLETLQGETPLVIPRRRAGGRGGRGRLDRHSGRRAWSRTRSSRAAPGRHAEPARHRPGPWPGDDRPAHRDHPRQARQSEQADRRLHAVRTLAASARPRPRWRWPNRSTAASRT